MNSLPDVSCFWLRGVSRLKAAGLRHAFALAAVALVSSAMPTLAESGPRWRSWDDQAMGHTGVTTSQGTGALFINPALLEGHEGGGFQLYGDLGLNSVLLDYAEWAAENYSKFSSIDSLLAHIQPVSNKWAPFAQSFVLAGSYNNYSGAIVDDIRYDLTLTKAVLTPVIGAGVVNDFVVSVGRGFTLPEDYRAGITVRYLHRSIFKRQLIGISDDRFADVYNTMKEKNEGLSSAQRKIAIASSLAESKQGAGLNLGVVKDIDEHWTVGASVLDAPAVLGGEPLKPQPNVGVSYGLDSYYLDGLVTHFTGNFDWDHFLIPGTPWFKQFKFGAGARGSLARKTGTGEVEPGREVFFLGLGINDGYPSFGIRCGYFFYVSYLYTVEETGTYPGQRPLSFHKLSIDIAI